MLEGGRCYQSVDEDFVRSLIRQFDYGEVALESRVCTSIEREDLHLDVRQGRHVEDLGQLRHHDLTAPDHPVQRRLIEHHGETRWAITYENLLTGELGLDLLLDLFRGEPRHGAFVASPRVVGGLQ